MNDKTPNFVIIGLDKLEQNKGQLKGLPSNPRKISAEKLELLKQNIEQYPEMLTLRGLMVYPYKAGEYIIIAGNMRYRAMQELGYESAPCVVIPKETTIDQLKAYAIIDNNGFGQWDWDMIAEDWNTEELTNWGLDVELNWGDDSVPIDTEDGDNEKRKEKIDSVENLLNDAMIENIKEFINQYELLKNNKQNAFQLTLGFCKAKFIRAKYYGERYPQYLSHYFMPQMFETSAAKETPFEAIKAIADQRTKSGIAGLRTMTEDGQIVRTIIKASYPFAGARLPLDFNANLAASLYNEFSTNTHPNILDPCHGWGGRLVGALLIDAKSYTGVDPSDEANAGVNKIAQAYGCYSPNTKINIINGCFEDIHLQEESFDIALTSPPYFDVEKYHGEQQSHIKFPKYDLWRDGFYRELIEKSYNALRFGCVFLLQVGGQSYPLIKDGVEIAKQVGFIVEQIRPYGGSTGSSIHGNKIEDDDNEKIIVLRKNGKR